MQHCKYILPFFKYSIKPAEIQGLQLKFSVPRACPGNSLIFMYAPPTETENLGNRKSRNTGPRCVCVGEETRLQ